MIVDTSKRSTRRQDKRFHTAYGIQSWLCDKGFCLLGDCKSKVNKTLYKNLLIDFMLSENNKFNFTTLESGIYSMEQFAQKNWRNFCEYAKNEYK